jgi:hypothetical protein
MHEPFGSVEPPFLILFFGGTNMLKTAEADPDAIGGFLPAILSQQSCRG